MMKNIFKISICFILILSVFSINAFALTTSTYGDLSQSNSAVQNLISYANNYPDFLKSDYVVFQNGQYSYYIFWGDLEYNGSFVTATDAKSISYIREGSGYDYEYKYTYSDAQTLSLTVNDTVISNIEGLGSSSVLYAEFESYSVNRILFIFMLAFMFVMMLLAFRRTF